MYKIRVLIGRFREVFFITAITGLLLGRVGFVFSLSNSSINLSDPKPNKTAVTYTFDAANFDNTTAVKCISLDFNDQANGLGAVPTGLVTTGATLDVSGTLITEASWTSSFAVNGSLDITNNTGESPASAGSLVYTGITNGSGTSAHFAILNSYTNTDCTTGAVDSTIVAFVYTDGTGFALTINPTITFSVAGVASGSVNGATITHSSTPTNINFLSDANTVTNAVSAHDIQISTNTSSGYTIYIRESPALANGNGDPYATHSGTNLAPTTMPVGTEAWGYTTNDATLSNVGNGPNRFTSPANGWAGFSTTNKEIAYNSVAPVGTETIRVGHQIGVASTTLFGIYTTTIVYTLVASF